MLDRLLMALGDFGCSSVRQVSAQLSQRAGCDQSSASWRIGGIFIALASGGILAIVMWRERRAKRAS